MDTQHRPARKYCTSALTLYINATLVIDVYGDYFMYVVFMFIYSIYIYVVCIRIYNATRVFYTILTSISVYICFDHSIILL